MKNFRALSSKWDGLNASLLASIWPVDSGGRPISGGVMVRAPLVESNLEVSANWQSAFEQSGVEGGLPTATAIAQAGAIGQLLDLFGKGSGEDSLASAAQRLASEAIESAQTATQGRSGLTKLNSQQVFTGAMPIKLTATLLFRAFDNPTSEVVEPVDQLIRWTLARELALNGSLVQAIKSLAQGQGPVKSVWPSLTPTMVAVQYGGTTLAPMVIESVSKSMTVPRYRDGNALQEQVQVTFGTLTALDENDWVRARRGAAIRLFNNS